MIPGVDGDAPTPDWIVYADQISASFGGLVPGLLIVLGAAISVRAVWWGVPRIIRFLTIIQNNYRG